MSPEYKLFPFTAIEKAEMFEFKLREPINYKTSILFNNPEFIEYCEKRMSDRINIINRHKFMSSVYINEIQNYLHVIIRFNCRQIFKKHCYV